MLVTERSIHTMAEIRQYTQRTSKIGWLALIIAILALVIAWIAYNRTGANLEDTVQRQVSETLQATDKATEEAGRDAQQGADTVERGLDVGPDGVDDGTR